MREFTAAVLYTNEEGQDGEIVEMFDSEKAARAWLADTDGLQGSTKELWHGRQQLSFPA